MSVSAIDSTFSSINSVATNKVVASGSGNELTQSDFIELLVAQIKNQDPTEPMDSSEFMSQLTQSSMVNGQTELQASFDALATKLSSDQSLQAAGLVGKSVMLPGGQASLSTGGTVDGELVLESQSSDVNLNIFNSSGEQVRTLALGGHDAGSVQFKWDGFADDGSVVPEGHYLVTAEGLIDGKQQAIAVALQKRIDSVSLNKSIDGSPSGTVLNLSSGQSVSLNDVTQIK